MPRGRYTKIQAWRMFKYHGAFAECPIGSPSGKGLRPEDVDLSKVGHHSSIGFERGKRVYSFEKEEDRDTFVQLYGHLGAKPCEDPYP